MRSLWLLCCVQFLIGFAGLSHQVSSPNDSYYVAGVVEFEPAAPTQSSLEQLDDNLIGYLGILGSPEAYETDIVVFPELTLNNVLHHTYVPDPKDKVTPCNNNVYEEFFQELSCAARDVKKYVVINVLEMENCTSETQAAKNDPRPCASNALSTYNTNVVFDREGMVVARYRKYNVYGEPRNVTYVPELSTFDTDFGVRFGLFICFDINFYSPAMDLVKMGVTDMIYTTFWYSELPFLTAVQLQQAWAYANEVNLLAAGASYPSIGTTGSGIYAGKQGALVSVMARSGQRKLYVANVTKHTHQRAVKAAPRRADEEASNARENLEGLKLMREYRMEEFTSQHLQLSDGGTMVERDLCHESFCCHFSLKMKRLATLDGSSSYQYHLAVFDGDRQYSGNGYTKYRLCAIYACTNTSLESCGKVFDDRVVVSPEVAFESIVIEADFPSSERALIMPNSLDQNLYPLTVDRFDFEIKDGKTNHRVRHTLLKTSEDLLTFGIYANYFDGNSSSDILSSSFLTALIGTLIVLVAVRFCVDL